MGMKYDAILIRAEDNVATALKDLEAGHVCNVMAGKGSLSVALREPIAYGHKFAVVDIPKGTDILKYGEVMGRATAFIPQGRHAHVHNVESLRGRGDLKGEGA